MRKIQSLLSVKIIRGLFQSNMCVTVCVKQTYSYIKYYYYK